MTYEEKFKLEKQESVRKLLEIEWQDHFHMRDQTWKTLQINAALVIGLVGIDMKFTFVWVTTIIGLLIVLSSLSGYMITLHHMTGQRFKFENIIRFEKWLGLIAPDLLKDVTPPEPFKWLQIFHLRFMNTSIFIMRMHIAIAIFAIVYVVARIQTYVVSI